jgi:D-alanyl-D-alanine carboxypeptidase (penicillin-binding protein 5/6)
MESRRRRAAKKKKKRRFIRMFKNYARRAAVFAGGLLLLVLLVTLIVKTVKSHGTDQIAEDTQQTAAELVAEATAEPQVDETPEEPAVGIGWNYPDEDGWYTVGGTKILDGFYANRTDATVWPSEDDVTSTYAVLINESTNEIVAAKNEDTIVSPASMTKILTVLVAAEHIEDLDDTFTITLDITDYAYVHDCSSVGFLNEETVTVRDLFYGTILPSGGDAAVALATYVAGSQEEFVDMMNEKLEELGLSETAHFTNCIGLYDPDHYCTVYDMAMILKAAVENDWCREVLSAHTYTTTSTEQHPDGITISNWFLRRIEDKDTGGEVLCAKTGFVAQSRNCAASYFISEDGTPYICVTADAASNWRCIYDHVALYSNYAKE